VWDGVDARNYLLMRLGDFDRRLACSGPDRLLNFTEI
jgi:hypothetical protein